MIIGFAKDPAGKNCPNGKIVTTVDKCKDASAVLDLTYTDKRYNPNFPAGCHWMAQSHISMQLLKHPKQVHRISVLGAGCATKVIFWPCHKKENIKI